MSYWVKQVNNGSWHVVGTYEEKMLKCQLVGWATRAEAKEALRKELEQIKADKAKPKEE